MANLFDYLEHSQYDSFYDKEPTVLDILALTDVTYLPFDGLIAADCSKDTNIFLKDLKTNFDQAFIDGLPPLSMANNNRLELLEKLATYKRYKHIKAFSFIHDYNLDDQKQFAACSYQIRPNEFLVVFRGTDDTLIGWKEDFHMTYMEEIPAQVAACDYLSALISSNEGHFWVAGHSKGGNLATYASSQIAPDLQRKIQGVYSFDAPGVHTSVIESDGFKQIAERLHPIIPQGSIVGMMLEIPEKTTIVKSNTIGLLQHNTFSWEVDVEKADFIQVDKVSDDSIQVDLTLKYWVENLTQEELKDYFDLFFGLFLEAGITRFSDITIDTWSKIEKVMDNSQNLTEGEREILVRLSRLLLDTRIEIFKQYLSDSKEALESSLKEKWDELDELKPLASLFEKDEKNS